MIIPVVCITCGKPIGHLWDRYNKLVEHYSKILDPKGNSAEYLALKDLKFFRTCCRRMFLCQQDMYDKISGPTLQ